MIGIVLAAGIGARLRPLTDDLPKTLLPIADGVTLLDVALANLAAVGVEEAVVVTGHASAAVEGQVPALEERFGLEVSTLFNPEAASRNNAYSLWLAREHLERGALVVNGDTLCPVGVLEALLGRRTEEPPFDVALAVDDVKALGDEEMKVVVGDGGSPTLISKGVDPATAHGEYIGVALVSARGAPRLVEALEATWSRDPGLYYEDGFQALLESGGRLVTVPVGGVEWVEVDDHDDLERARSIGCPS